MGIEEAFVISCDGHDCDKSMTIKTPNAQLAVGALTNRGWVRPNVQLFYCPDCKGEN